MLQKILPARAPAVLHNHLAGESYLLWAEGGNPGCEEHIFDQHVVLPEPGLAVECLPRNHEMRAGTVFKRPSGPAWSEVGELQAVVGGGDPLPGGRVQDGT